MTAELQPAVRDASAEITSLEIAAAADHIATSAAAPAADDVHYNARFPVETLAALKAAGLLGAMVPRELGGWAARLGDMVAVTRVIARQCTSAAMIFAMHQIQVAMLLHHGHTDGLQLFLRRLASEQLLIASAASEVGIGGDARRSICAIEPQGRGYRLEKHASVLSYGAYADAVLATARRGVDARQDEQVMVLCARPHFSLAATGPWDAMGLRGTDSRSFQLVADIESDFVLPDAGADILGGTGLATNNLLQCAVWLGLAEAAAWRAHGAVRARARRDTSGNSPGSLRLAEIAVPLEQLRETIGGATKRSEAVLAGAVSSDARLALAMNTLKVSCSSLVLDVVQRAMLVCGIDGYRGPSSPYSLERHLADAYGAAIMVSNDRLLLNSADLLKMLKQM